MTNIVSQIIFNILFFTFLGLVGGWQPSSSKHEGPSEQYEDQAGSSKKE